MHTFTLSIENVFSNKVFDKLCYLIIILIFSECIRTDISILSTIQVLPDGELTKTHSFRLFFGDFALNGELASEYTNVYKYLKS